MTKVVINQQHGGFSLSEAAYEKLVEYGVPVREYIKQQQDPETRHFLPEPRNEGEVIFDRRLGAPNDMDLRHISLFGPYWENWIEKARSHELLLRVVEELGADANGRHATLKVVKIPDDVEWTIEEYDGLEWVAEKHRTWGGWEND